MIHARLYTTLLSVAVLAAGCESHSTAMAQATLTHIPSVGCPADGQDGQRAAPPDSTHAVTLDTGIARQVAYFHGNEGAGVYAPRGWRCFIAYGSNGSTIVVGPSVPTSISDWGTRISGPVVAVGISDGGTSGRFDVASYAMLLFPSVAAKFIADVKGEGIVSEAALTLGPFPLDSLVYADSLTVEFTTPGGRAGLGTAGRLAPSQDPIHGMVVLDTAADWSAVTLDIRLDTNHGQLEDILFALNKACIRSDAGC